MLNQEEFNNSIYGYGDMLLAYGYAKSKMISLVQEAYKVLNSCKILDTYEKNIYIIK